MAKVKTIINKHITPTKNVAEISFQVTSATENGVIDWEQRNYRGSQLAIFTGTGGTGTQLIKGTDYSLVNLNASITSDADVNVYSGVNVTNATYHNIDLYVPINTIDLYGDSLDASDINRLQYQIDVAIANASMFVGMPIAVAWNDDPVTLGYKALPLIGQGVLIGDYGDLDNVVYKGDANNATASCFYHADDEAGTIRNTAGLYLILPNARGRAIRGLDPTGLIDPDGASRDLGSPQGSAMWGHTHDIRSYSGGSTANFFALGLGNPGGVAFVYDSVVSGAGTGTGIQQATNDGTNGAPDLTSESRIINLAFDWMITY